MTSCVEVTRGDLVESRHLVSVAVADATGRLVAWSGEPRLVAFWRSAAKPFQAVPLVADGAADARGIGDEELALSCASHNGEAAHVEIARRLLSRAGASEEDLVCGPHASLSDAVARDMSGRGERPTRIHNNCSGKHAAMITVARHAGWGSDGYHRPAHPAQRRCLAEVAAWCSLAEASIPHGTDGCGVPSFAVPLSAMAVAYARLGAAAEGDPVGGIGSASLAAARRVLGAMRRHPFLVAGTGRLDSDLIEASRGQVVSKVGAEGVYCATLPGLRLGVALKIHDGALRALGPALLAVLDTVAPGMAPRLDQHRNGAVTNTLRETVGSLDARVNLVRDASPG
jgi:L-asparaginase II